MTSIIALLVVGSMIFFEMNYNVLENLLSHRIYSVGKGSMFDLMPLSYSITIPVYEIAKTLFMLIVLTGIIAAMFNIHSNYKQASIAKVA